MWQMAALMAGQYLLSERQAKKARRAEQGATQQTYERWLENAYPSAEKIGATREQSMNILAMARDLATQRLTSNLAGRGFGPRSPMNVGKMGGIEGEYLKTVGNLESELTKMANTPTMPMPGQAYPSGDYYGGGDESLQQALGMMMAWQMLGGIQSNNPNLNLTEPSLNYTPSQPNYGFTGNFNLSSPNYQIQPMQW